MKIMSPDEAATLMLEAFEKGIREFAETHDEEQTARFMIALTQSFGIAVTDEDGNILSMNDDKEAAL